MLGIIYNDDSKLDDKYKKLEKYKNIINIYYKIINRFI
jgi:hypothetical protein